MRTGLFTSHHMFSYQFSHTVHFLDLHIAADIRGYGFRPALISAAIDSSDAFVDE